MSASRRLTIIAWGVLFAALSWTQVQAAETTESPQQRVATLKAWIQASRGYTSVY